jgi:hypothetical protein
MAPKAPSTLAGPIAAITVSSRIERVELSHEFA